MVEDSKIILNKNMLLISALIVVAGLALFWIIPALNSPVSNLPTGANVIPISDINQPTQTAPSVQPKQAQTGSSVGNSAPDFTITTVDGKQIRLSDSRKNGKSVLVYFFASWCPFCKSDLTAVKSVYPKYQNKIDFLVVDLDTTEGINKIRDYRDLNGYVGEFAPGSRKLLIDYNVLSTTTKFAIDKNGIIIWRGSGAIGSGDWEKLFSSLVDL